MNYYVKALPDNTFTLMTDSGYIIGKFDEIDEMTDICFDGEAMAAWQAPAGQQRRELLPSCGEVYIKCGEIR
jgi:hypothetical protein